MCTEPSPVLRAARRRALAALLLLGAALPGRAADDAPWYPSEWGAEDQRGAANRLTAERTRAALRLATTGRIYPLGQPFRADMPIWGGRSFQLLSLIHI